MKPTTYQNLPTIDEENRLSSTVEQPKTDQAIISEININTFKVIALIIVLALIVGPIYIMFTNNEFLPKEKVDKSNNIYVLAYSWQPEFCDNKDYIGCVYYNNRIQNYIAELLTSIFKS
jgi:ribonuclease I